MCNHDCAAVSRQGVFQEASELRVSVIHVSKIQGKINTVSCDKCQYLPGFSFGQCVDAVSQGQQAAVDVSALFQAFAAVLRSKFFESAAHFTLFS